MSGIEVAGLVIGVVPIVITALEEYQQFNRKRDAFSNRKLHVARMIRALTEHQVLIEGDVEVLLRSVDFEGNIADVIKAGDCKKLLAGDGVADDVSELLGATRYKAYIEALGRSEECLFSVAKQISKLKPGSWACHLLTSAHR
jgi:hypothetical protein